MNWFSNMKIGRKLIAGFLLVAGIACAIGLVGFSGMKSIQNSEEKIGKVYMPGIEALTNLKSCLQAVLVGERGLLIDGFTGDTREAQYAYIDSAFEDADKSWAIYDALSLTAEGEALWEAFKKQWNEWKPLHQAVVDLSEQRDRLTAAGYAEDSDEVTALDNQALDAMMTARTKWIELESAISDMSDRNNQIASDYYEASEQSATQSIVLLVVIMAAGAVLAVILGVVISRNINNPLQKALEMIQTMSQGDLRMRLGIRTKDEIGVMAQKMDEYAETLNRILGEIYEAAEQVSSGSSQVSDGSQELSQGATEQASAIEELTSSVSQIAAQTRQNAENAGEANKLADEARRNAEQGNNQMGKMLDSMDEINQSSTNISKIIKVIDDIAFQTNILALNAAVEAARAGQHGKGFAVVAEEVRNLAAKSAGAAKETTALIEGSMNKVSAGTQIANETAKSLEKIVNDVARAAELVSRIATASNEQAAGIAQIDKGIEQVSQVVQTNSATAEQSASASEELSGQAQILKDMVSQFKLSGTGQAGAGKSTARAAVKKTDKGREGKTVPSISLNDLEYGKY